MFGSAQLSGLPPYPGSKRRLCPVIFALLERDIPASAWPDLRFCDAFLGSGAVVLTAKARGFGHVVARHRRVRRVLTVPYRHYGPLASAQKNAANREMLIIATRHWNGKGSKA